MTMTKVYDEIIDFIAAGASPAEVVAFKPSEQMQARVSDLLDREKGEGLSPEEKAELDHYLILEHIMRLAKAKARKYLSQA